MTVICFSSERQQRET